MKDLDRSFVLRAAGLAVLATIVFSTAGDAQIQIQVGGKRGAAAEESLGGGNLFVEDRRRTQALKQANELLENKRYTEGIRVLQSLIELPGDSFYFPDVETKTKFLSTKSEAMRLLETLPDAGRRVYELKYGIKSTRDLKDALAKGKFSEVEKIARLYFHTDAGYEAAYLLASHQLDAGKSLSAALNFERLRRVSRAGVRNRFEPMLSLKTAVAWGRAGMPNLSIDTLMEFKQFANSEDITLGNKKVRLFTDRKAALPWLVASLGRERGFAAIGKEQWTQFRGDASRTAHSAPASPVWDSEWSIDTVRETGFAEQRDRKSLEAVAAKIQALVKKRKQENKNALMIPAVHPLIVGKLAVFRSLRTLWAVDLTTGELVWRSFIKDEAFQRLAKIAGAKSAPKQAQPVNNGRRIIRYPSTNRGKVDPMEVFLDQRLWRDLNAGTLSSDGEFIYSVEGLDFYNPTNLTYNSRTRSTSANLLSYNNLMAINAKTGKLAWMIGGADGSNSQLAGYFFLGPPLALGEQLFCLAATKDDIRLVALGLKREMKPKDTSDGAPTKEWYEAVSPKVLWTQTLITPNENIKDFPLRRMSGLTPSYSGGVLVCPTTSGAVVAVDPGRRLLLWGYRYRTNTESGGGRRNVFIGGRRMLPMNPYDAESRWLDAGITMADGRIILTPRDSNELHCVNLVDGNLIWKKPRGEMLYVAAIHNGNIIMGGQSQMSALGLSSGLPAWKHATPLPQPSGRGFQTKGYYHLPLSTGEIATLDLGNGRVLARTKTRSGLVPGNLVSANGQIVSQTIDRVSGFRSLTQLNSDIAARLKANPKDAAALASRGEMRLRSGQEEAGLEDLRASIKLKPSDRAKSLVGSVLLEGLRLDFAKFRKHRAELEKLLTDADEQARFRRILASGLHEVGEHKAAFREYLKLAGLNTNSWKNERVSGVLTVRGDRWLQTRLAGLFRSAKDADRKELLQAIEKQLAETRKQTGTKPLERFVRAFSELPIAEEARKELVNRVDGSKQPLRMEFLLESLKASSDRKLAGYATARLAELFVAQNRYEDAATMTDQLESEFAKTVCRNGKTGREIAAALKKSQPQLEMAHQARSPWPNRRFLAKATRERRGSYQTRYPFDFEGKQGPYFRGWSFSMTSTSSGTIEARDESGRQRWTINARKPNNNGRRVFSSYYGNSIRAHGHLLVAVLGNRFVVIDALAKSPKILWQRDLYEVPFGQAFNAGVVRQQIIRVGGRMKWVITDPNGNPLGKVGPITNDMIVYQVGKTVFAADPLTGDVLWKRSAVERGSRLFGDDRHVFVVPPRASSALALRGSDGEQLGTRPVAAKTESKATRGRHELTWRISGRKYLLTMTDVWTKNILWQRQFETSAKIELVEGDEVAVVELTKGRLTILALKDGATRADAKINPDPNLNYFMVRRSKERYVMLSYSPTAAGANPNFFNVRGINYYSPLVHGYVYGISRKTGRKTWAAYVQHQALDDNQTGSLPVMIMAARRYERINQGGVARRTRYKLAVTVLDLRNGHLVLDYDSPENISSAYTLTVNHAEKSINVKFYQSNITLTMSKTKAMHKPNLNAAAPKADVKPAKKKGAAGAKRAGKVKALPRPGIVLPRRR